MAKPLPGAQFKRGIIRENDAQRGMSKVEIADEDGVHTTWISWNMPAAGASKIYNQPDIGSQVNVLLDHRGEDGIILGARYSDEDKPPTDKGHLLKMLMEGGLDFEYDKGAGSLTIKLPAGLTFEADSVSIKGKVKINGPVEVAGASLVHNGKNVGSTHKHGGVTPGGGKTGDPD